MGIVKFTGIEGSRTAFVIAEKIKKMKGRCLIISPTYIGACKLAQDLSFFIDKKIYVMPQEEQLIEYETRNRDDTLEQLKILKAVIEEEDCVIISPVLTAIKKRPPKEVYIKNKIEISIEDEIDLANTMRSLVNMGYERVPVIYSRGQFSLRGGILDIFPPYEQRPIRIELFDIQVEEIRTFNVESQRSIEKKEKVVVYPAEEIVKDDIAFARARKKIEKSYKNLPERKEFLIDIIENYHSIQTFENYMDYLYEKPEYLWDYMSDAAIIIDDPSRAYEKVDNRFKELKNDFDVLMEKGKFIGKDLENFTSKKDFLKIYKSTNVILCTPFMKAIKGVETYEEIHNMQSHQVMSYNGNLELLEKELRRYIKKNYKVTIVCSTEECLKNIQDFLIQEDLHGRILTIIGTLSSGIDFPEEKICYITDGDIFGTYKRKKRKKNTETDKSKPIKSFTEINKGDFVVHESHGVGRFLGLEQLVVAGDKKDYLKIKYAGEDVLYVPVEQTNLIQKYIGGDADNVRVNKLSGSEWSTTKAKAKASIANMTKELLEMSAVRNSQLGYKFGEDTIWQKEFEDSFPYEETTEQKRCIEEIKRDMESDKTMERLLCGDVGYGKTEVAARAMFKCAAEGKQVAVLVPTTILASQHYQTLRERFEKFPFKVETLSRFRTEKEQREVIKKLEEGTVDLVIGTHRLLSNDIKFKDLGLLVVDEEQRFGVKDKEKIKKLKKNVDVLSMSATPIPRTLHMSLIGIKDMSLIEEPPEERYPIQTYIVEEEDYIIRDAIEREVDRGGQVYVVYNRINGIHKIAAKIKELVPNVGVLIGHGRMKESELEDVMMDFMNGESDVLISTTIIESGIDIPNVNTLIILDADKFGLSQLYQLRGRVGRSSRVSYAYLMHKKDKVLTEVAEKRLRAIKTFTEFGAGFKISMRDLEIRGAGNLLGTEQHGHMVKIGYEMYCKLVDEAVKTLQGENVEINIEATIDIKVSAYIPDDYIKEEMVKLSVYKKIAAILDNDEQKEIEEELKDRFGQLPKPVNNLIAVSRIKSTAENLGIEKISQQGKKITFKYEKRKGTKPVVIYIEGENILKEVGIFLENMLKV